jgi:Aldehyde dehydrogenase family
MGALEEIMRDVIVGTGKRLTEVVHRIATLLTSGSRKSRELQESKARLEEARRARRVASQIRAGRVVINGMTDDPQAPWGGFKYFGCGREYGQYRIEAFLETRAIQES